MQMQIQMVSNIYSRCCRCIYTFILVRNVFALLIYIYVYIYTMYIIHIYICMNLVQSRSQSSLLLLMCGVSAHSIARVFTSFSVESYRLSIFTHTHTV